MEIPTVDPPIRGEWKVIHNPGDSPHALDFIGLRPGRWLPYPPQSLLAHLVYRIPASIAYGWGRPVYAPFDGGVLEAHDGYPDTVRMNLIRDGLRNVVFLPDLDEGIQRFAGNYVVIEAAAGVAFLAHLQCNSLSVTTGDSVTAGEQIGVVGNAGASLISHLHFQLMRMWPSDISLVGELDRPFRFCQYDRRVDGTWKTVQNRRMKSSERIRVDP